MKIAYLLLAHNHPQHLGWLLRRLLQQPDCACFVHVDHKSEMALFRDALDQNVERISTLPNRHAVYWGDFSQVEAILALLQTAAGDPRNFDRFVLLSGVDAPLRSPGAIHAFFASHPKTEFINLVRIPNAAAGKPLSRIARYQPRPWEPTPRILARKAMQKLHLLPKLRDYKAVLGALEPYGGSTWWALTREAVRRVVTFAERETAIVRFFENTVSPDESFFHTIVGNSPLAVNARRNLTYTDWSARTASPANIGAEHLALFRNTTRFADDAVFTGGEMLFARKFKDGDLGLLDQLDRDIAAREAPAGDRSLAG